MSENYENNVEMNEEAEGSELIRTVAKIGGGVLIGGLLVKGFSKIKDLAEDKIDIDEIKENKAIRAKKKADKKAEKLRKRVEKLTQDYNNVVNKEVTEEESKED